MSDLIAERWRVCVSHGSIMATKEACEYVRFLRRHGDPLAGSAICIPAEAVVVIDMDTFFPDRYSEATDAISVRRGDRR